MEHNPAVSLLLAVSIIIAASRIGGAIARQLKQPRVLGELLVGVLLGPTLLNFLTWDLFHGVELQPTIGELAELGVVMLMFIIGLEVNLKELTQVGGVGVFAGILGVIVPIALSFPLMTVFGFTWKPALFAGVTLAATSVSISAQVLFELGLLQSKEGNALLATALIDDVLTILLVSVVVAVIAASGAQGGATNGSLGALSSTIFRMVAYLIGASLFAWLILPRGMNWLADLPSVSQAYGIPALALVVMFAFAWSAEALGGVATITGSFLAGIGMSRTREQIRDIIEESMSFIAYAFLVPIFFVDVGLSADLSTFPLSESLFAALLLFVAVIAKVAGCGMGALIGGFTPLQSLRLGVCMVSRGEVGLIVASIGLTVSVFERDSALFSTLFLVILLSTLLTPIMVRWVFSWNPAPPS